VQLDVNRRVTRNFFMRLNLVNRRNKTYVRGTNDVFRAADLAFTYEPFKTTSVRVELERGETYRMRADSALAINDVAASGRGFSTNNQWYYTSDKEILYRTSTFPAAIDRNGPSGNQVSLLQGQTQAVRLPDGTYKVFRGFDKYTNMLGTVDYNNRIFNVASVTIEQRIGKLAIEAAFNQQFQHEDRNDNSFGTSQTPPVLSVDSTAGLTSRRPSAGPPSRFSETSSWPAASPRSTPSISGAGASSCSSSPRSSSATTNTPAAPVWPMNLVPG
jgi:hypothetical protein